MDSQTERKWRQLRITCILLVCMEQHDYQHKTDEELAEYTLTNQAGFALIVERYEAKLRRYIHRITKVSKEDCDDILQEIFIKVYRNLAGFDTTLLFSSWIYRIAHNHVRSHFRKKQARPTSIPIEPDLLENMASDEDLHKSIDSKITKEHLGNALLQLDEKYRAVLILKFLEEKDYKEISDILQKPTGTIGIRISRAKKQLRTILEKERI